MMDKLQVMVKKIKAFWVWLKGDKKRLVVAGVVLLVILIVIVKIAKSKSTQTTYQTATVEKGNIVATVSASGQVLTTNTLSITTEASGVVKKVYVKDGDKVVAGQTLAEITLDTAGTEKNASAYASYVSAQNGVNSARNSYRSAQASVEKVLDEVKGHDTDETFAQKESRTKAEVARDNAYDNIRQVEANLVSASYNYRSTSPVITAPFSGVVESVGFVEGMVLESSSSTTSINNKRVAVIKGDSLPVISVSLSEIDVPKIKVGQKATITLDSLADKTFTGKVMTVDKIGTVTSGVTNYPVVIRFDTQAAEILPNMSATANIILDAKNGVLLVPTAAVSNLNGQQTVRILKNRQVTTVNVETGLTSDSQVEITSGVSEGDAVVTGTSSSTTTTSSSGSSVFSGGFGGGTMRVR
jgi:RND family efflux transporter MFP subunit